MTRTERSDPDGGARRWVVVLAGGAGRRLEAMTTDARGSRVPKQYCALRGERSLLQMALARAERLVPGDRIVVVVQRDHRSWWSRELADLPSSNVLVQPADRGTGVGLHLALLSIAKRDPGAVIAALPADHYMAREDLFARGVETAFGEVERKPEVLVLLAVAGERPDPSLGWIVPGAPDRDAVLLPVEEFHEKPSPERARGLLERGALVNCFVPVAGLGAFQRLLEGAPSGALLPPLFADAAPDAARLAAAFERMPRLDLSADVFASRADRLAVLPLPGVGWSDLGTPAGVRRCLGRDRVPRLPARHGVRAPVDLSRPRPAMPGVPTFGTPDLARYTEML